MLDIGRWRRRGLAGLCAVLLASAAAAALGDAPVPQTAPTGPAWLSWRPTSLIRHGAVTSQLRAAAVTWIGGATRAATGETVTVYVSASLSPDFGTPQTWADYFAGLAHGSELATLVAYVASYQEVQQLCHSEDVLGCYGAGVLVTIGEALPWIDPGEVATHEYGHHVAANRDNYPWRAIDWGTKRWATVATVCQRAATASVYPGDEGDHYRLNPGEGFAEVYRAVNERARGAVGFNWQIVDSTFYPDEAALRAAAQDVVEPWAQSAPSTVRARFTPNGRKTWSVAVATPLDGLLTARLVLPQTRPYKLALLAQDGKTVLARGSWSSARAQTLTFTVCGQRTVLLRVTRAAQAGRFSVVLAKP